MTSLTNTIATISSARTAKSLMSKWGKVEGAAVYFRLYGVSELTTAATMAKATKMADLVAAQVKACS